MIRTKEDLQNANPEEKATFLKLMAGACIKERDIAEYPDGYAANIGETGFISPIIEQYVDEAPLTRFGLTLADITLPELLPPRELYTADDIAAVVEEATANKIAELSAACEAQIISGFESSVLGTPHRYQSERDDQLNLVGMAATGGDCFVKCSADGGTTWEYKLHTAANMQQLLNEASSLKHGLLEKFLALKNTVLQAATGDEVSAVVW